MWRVSLSNLWAKKFRLVSTSLSVLIGVAFLSGSLVLLDTIGKTFDDLFATVNEGVDAAIRDADVVESDFGDLRGRIDEGLLDDVLAVPGVEAAEGNVAGYAQLVKPDGEVLGNPGQGPPTLGFNWGENPDLSPMGLVEGRSPANGTEIAIDRGSANDGPFGIGDEVTVLLEGPPRQFTVVGIASFGTADSPLGSTVTMFDLATAQEVLAEPGMLDSIAVVSEPGISQIEIRDRIAAAMPEDIEVITGEELIDEQQDAVSDALSFFNTFMVIFAVIALFVAAFIIYNTFSILLGQRTRELALLRALGARRSQIVGSVLIEAVVVGLLASLVGVVAGIGVASLLKQLLDAFGLSIPSSGVVFGARTIWVSLVVGVVVTVAAALNPSRRASTIAPMVAIRSAAVDGSDQLNRRLVFAVGILAVSVAALMWGLFGDPGNRVLAIGGGAAGVFLGVAALGPVLAVPFARIVGRPIAALGGVPGELAQENTARNPKRTSTTAAALMIGVGLVAAISIFAESAKASIDKIIDDAFVGDLVIDSGTFGFGGLSPELSARLNELPEVEAASGVRLGFAEIDGSTRTLFGVDPATMGDIVDVGVIEGDIETLDDNDLAVHEEFAADRNWVIGDTVDIRFAETGVQEFEVAILYERDELTGNFFMGNPAFEVNYPNVFDFQVYVLRDPAATPDEAREAVEAVAADYPSAEVQDLQEFKQAQADQVNQLLGLIYALLALAIIIALIGIANTLALSVLERTREIGLLRAVGMTRRQLRRSLHWEAVLIALLGTVLGMVIGVFFGWVIVEALADEGFTELRFPLLQLLIVVVIATGAGVAAAIRPSRRAAKMPVLTAIANG